MVKLNKIEVMHRVWLKQKIKKLYGKKCKDFEKECYCCQAWDVYQTIIDENKDRQEQLDIYYLKSPHSLMVLPAEITMPIKKSRADIWPEVKNRSAF